LSLLDLIGWRRYCRQLVARAVADERRRVAGTEMRIDLQ
jgi:hypothetical protein